MKRIYYNFPQDGFGEYGYANSGSCKSVELKYKIFTRYC